MRRFLLHIGLEKTGSTSFQAFCADHRDRLLQLGVLYPSNRACFEKINHAPLVASYFSPADARALLIAGRRADRAVAMAALKAEIETANAPRALVSAEHFSSRFDPGRIAQLAADLSGFEVEIVVVVRHPLARAVSAYATTVASGRILDLDAFVDELAAPSNPYLRSRATIEPWASVFSRERMIVIAYREGEDVVAALAQRLLPGAPTASDYRRNVSPRAAEIERRRRANAGSKAGVWRIFNERLSRLIGGGAQRQSAAALSLTPDQARRIEGIAADDLVWLKAQYGVDFP